MTNKEKFKEEIDNIILSRDCDQVCEFIKKHVIKKKECSGFSCAMCGMIYSFWIEADYKEECVDWSQVEVDTPILVSQTNGEGTFVRRYFAKYEDGKVYAWKHGATSWSSEKYDICAWKYAKLAEVE